MSIVNGPVLYYDPEYDPTTWCEGKARWEKRGWMCRTGVRRLFILGRCEAIRLFVSSSSRPDTYKIEFDEFDDDTLVVGGIRFPIIYDALRDWCEIQIYNKRPYIGIEILDQ